MLREGGRDMRTSDHLIEQHIQENQAHLKHIDELMDQAQTKAETATSAESQKELAGLKKERDEYARYVNELQRDSEEKLMQKTGPIVMWQLIAEKLEKLIERLEK
jgi:DNA-binding protein H-NS